jgi:hypothetical protein
MLDFLDLEFLLSFFNFFNWNMYYTLEEESIPYMIGTLVVWVIIVLIIDNTINAPEPKKKKNKKKSTYEGIFFFKRNKQNSDINKELHLEKE